MFDSEMATLLEEEASIIVLLAEAYDGAIVRTVLSQVLVSLLRRVSSASVWFCFAFGRVLR